MGMNRRNFLKAAAAAVLGLVSGFKRCQEPMAKDEQTFTFYGEINEAEVQLIMERLRRFELSQRQQYFVASDEVQVFQGLDHLITTGYQDADTKSRCPPLPDCPVEVEVREDCDGT